MLLSQSRSSSFRYVDEVETTDVQTQCQNGVESVIEVTLKVSSGLSTSGTADHLEISRTTISRVYREWSEKVNTQCATVVWTKMPRWCQKKHI